MERVWTEGATTNMRYASAHAHYVMWVVGRATPLLVVHVTSISTSASPHLDTPHAIPYPLKPIYLHYGIRGGVDGLHDEVSIQPSGPRNGCFITCIWRLATSVRPSRHPKMAILATLARMATSSKTLHLGFLNIWPKSRNPKMALLEGSKRGSVAVRGSK